MKKNQNFGQALEALKQGAAISREGWNGKGMFLWLNKGSYDPHQYAATHGALIGIEGVRIEAFEPGPEGHTTRLPNINMRAATGNIVTGWLASQTDMLAEDWCIAEEEDAVAPGTDQEVITG